MSGNRRDDEGRAEVGVGGYGGGSRQVPASVELALQQAHTDAGGAVTVEHVLLALLDEPTALELFSNVNIGSMRTALRQHLTAVEAGAPSDARRVSLQNVMRRAFTKSMATNRPATSGADIVVAMLVEGDSFAAQTLREHGLTVEQADDRALDIYLNQQAENARRYEALKKNLAERAARPKEGPQLLASAIGTTESGLQRYTLRVSSEEPTEFKAAVSHDGQLDLHFETTPFETELIARSIVVLFETLDRNQRLRVQLFIPSKENPLVSVGGAAGAIFEDGTTLKLIRQKSGRLD
jgi:ClpA/ClpB-like protein